MPNEHIELKPILKGKSNSNKDLNPLEAVRTLNNYKETKHNIKQNIKLDLFENGSKILTEEEKIQQKVEEVLNRENEKMAQKRQVKFQEELQKQKDKEFEKSLKKWRKSRKNKQRVEDAAKEKWFIDFTELEQEFKKEAEAERNKVEIKQKKEAEKPVVPEVIEMQSLDNIKKVVIQTNESLLKQFNSCYLTLTPIEGENIEMQDFNKSKNNLTFDNGEQYF